MGARLQFHRAGAGATRPAISDVTGVRHCCNGLRLAAEIGAIERIDWWRAVSVGLAGGLGAHVAVAALWQEVAPLGACEVAVRDVAGVRVLGADMGSGPDRRTEIGRKAACTADVWRRTGTRQPSGNALLARPTPGPAGRAAHYRTARLPRESRLIALPNQAAHCPRHRSSGPPCPSASLTGSRRC